MSKIPNQNNEILRAAIAWALSIADAAEETLIAAVLAEALFHAESPIVPFCAVVPAQRSDLKSAQPAP